MPSRRALTLAVTALAAAIAAYFLFGPSDERRVLGVLRELAAAVSSQPGDTAASRGRRIRASFAKRLADDAVLRVPELGDVEGRAELAELLDISGGAALELTLDVSDVQFEPGNERARASLIATLILRYPGEERRDSRPTTIDLVKAASGDEWRVIHIDVGREPRIHPEARP